MRVGALFELTFIVPCKVFACLWMSLDTEQIVTILDIGTDDIDMLFWAVLLHSAIAKSIVPTDNIFHSIIHLISILCFGLLLSVSLTA